MSTKISPCAGPGGGGPSDNSACHGVGWGGRRPNFDNLATYVCKFSKFQIFQGERLIKQ